MALVVTFATPVVYRTTSTGSAGGSITYSAGTFKAATMDVVYGASANACSVNVHYTTDAGDSGVYSFPCNPSTQTIEAALTSALATTFPGVSTVISFVAS